MIFEPALDPTARKQLENSPKLRHFPIVFSFCWKTQLPSRIHRFSFNWSVAINLPIISITFSASFSHSSANNPTKLKLSFRRLISFSKCASLAMMHAAVFFSSIWRQWFWLAQIFLSICARAIRTWHVEYFRNLCKFANWWVIRDFYLSRSSWKSKNIRQKLTEPKKITIWKPQWDVLVSRIGSKTSKVTSDPEIKFVNATGNGNYVDHLKNISDKSRYF